MRRRGHPSERVRATWDHVRTSLWFVPAVMTLIGGGGLTAAGLALDAALGTDTAVPGWVYVASPDDARTILTTLLQSMMTMTSLVFSITMVVLTLAARQFGPRLVRNFMGSLATQVVLGTFVTTIVYCLLVLSAVGWRGEEGLFPYASVTIAIALSLVSVGMLVFFIHALSRSLFAEVVIERVGRELDGAQAELRPLAPEDGEDPEQVLPADFADRARYFGPTIAGYVQAIEFERLVAIAAENDLFLGFHFRAGDYVAADGRGIGAYPGERIRPDLIEAINGAVVVGTQRTLVQDLEFPIRHLVEIAVRALSPGTNDPYTAVAALHRLSAAFAELMGRALPPGVFRDRSGAVRVVCPRPTYAGLLGAAFDQIRQNGADKPLVLIHMAEAVTRIADHARRSDQVEALRDQLRVIDAAAARSVEEPADRNDVRRHVEKAEQALLRAEGRCGPPTPPRDAG